jgi:hypothetical protein
VFIKYGAGRYIVKYKKSGQALKNENSASTGVAMHHYREEDNAHEK